MAASYKSAVSALYALGHELATAKPRRFDLENMRKLAEAMGHPERRFASVLVAGTNGKGSTSATLASILHSAGYRTALYTSPHLVRINERMQVNGEAISDAEFTEMYRRVDEIADQLVRHGAIEQHPSFFEMMTAMAFEYFASVRVEIAVLEVGMGGRLDATNIVDPCVSVITDVALDHQQYLGNTVGEIAREKAGIIRKGGIVVTLPQHPEANDVIGNTILECEAKGVSAVRYVPNVSPGAVKFDHLGPMSLHTEFLRTRYFLEVGGEEIFIETPLIGRHQLRNVALAIAAAAELAECGFPLTPAQIAEGVRNTKWPGRFQLIAGSPDFVLDVAHNPAGAWALRSALSENFGERAITFIFGGMKDKALAEMAQILFPLAANVVLTHAETPRAATTDELKHMLGPSADDAHIASTVSAAIAKAREVTPKNGLVVATGSIYIVGEALAQLQPQ
jgi:dihydrofolate synthase / folylpolyglutamate synthase